jgi:hypothetical protein
MEKGHSEMTANRVTADAGKRREFPFVPKSAIALCPGDFWAVPVSDGSFACGRVLELMPKGVPGERVAFLGGLLDWHASLPPTADSIARAGTVEQGVMHVRAIINSGGEVLGHRPLQLDGLEPATFVNGNSVQKGFTRLREWCPEDTARFPSLSYWSYDVITTLAHKHFLGRRSRNA